MLLLFTPSVYLPWASSAYAESPTWSCSGPFGGQILALGISPAYAIDGILFAGTASNGLFASYDGGENWAHVSAFSAQTAVSSIVLSPAFAEDHTLFVSTTGEGILKSWDGGETWSPWNGGLLSLSVPQVALSPHFAVDQTCLAATSRGMHRSASAGKVWQPVGPDARALAVAIAVAPGGDLEAFGGFSSGLHISRDGGQVWQPTTLDAGPIVALAVSPDYATDRTVLAGTLSGAYLSTDGGETWEGPWFASLAVHQVLFSPAYAMDHALFLGTSGGVYVSRDGGAHWSELGNARDIIHDLAAFYDREGITLYAATDHGGVIYSDDGGSRWVARNTGLANVALDAVALSPHYTQDRTVYAGGEKGIWRSQDDGQSWERLPLEGVSINALRCPLDESVHRTVYAATNGGLFISTDRGQSWRAATPGPQALHVLDIAVSPTGQLWLGTANGGVYYASPGLSFWEARSNGLAASQVMALEWLGVGEQTTYLIAGTWGDGAFASRDGGLAWQRAAGPEMPHVRDLASAEGYGGLLWAFAATTGGLCQSTDKGQSWDCRSLVGLDLSSVAMHPQYAAHPILYAAGQQDGIYRSLNGGVTWNSLNQGLGTLDVRELALGLDRDGEEVLFAATGGGMWRYGGVPQWPQSGYRTLVLPLVSPGFIHSPPPGRSGHTLRR